MAWTTDRDRAQWFADRFSIHSPEHHARERQIAESLGAVYEGEGDPRFRMAHVYTVTADPSAVLADVDAIEGQGGRKENEIIVDPSMLGRLRRA